MRRGAVRRRGMRSAMLCVRRREDGDGDAKQEENPAGYDPSQEDTAAFRRSASAGRAGSCCVPRHGSPSFFLGRHDGSASHIATSTPPAARLCSILRGIAGVIIQICIERTQLLIDLRIAVQQLQIVHGRGLLG